MSRPTWPALILLVVAAPETDGQGRPTIGLAAIGVGSEPAFAGVGPAVTAPLAYQVRVRALAVLGARSGSLGARGEVMLALVSNPRSRGWGAFGGVGGAAVSGERGGGYLVVSLGFEQSPLTQRGWWIEGGVGGGARLVVGYRAPVGRAAPNTTHDPTTPYSLPTTHSSSTPLPAAWPPPADRTAHPAPEPG